VEDIKCYDMLRHECNDNVPAEFQMITSEGPQRYRNGLKDIEVNFFDFETYIVLQATAFRTWDL
jgi:hypothetical protein